MYFSPPLMGFFLELGIGVKNDDEATGSRKKFDVISSRLHTVHVTDRRTD